MSQVSFYKREVADPKTGEPKLVDYFKFVFDDAVTVVDKPAEDHEKRTYHRQWSAYQRSLEPAETDDAPESVEHAGAPTIADWVAAGYRASNYPPSGFASKSSAEEIAAAVEQQAAADKAEADAKAKLSQMGGPAPT